VTAKHPPTPIHKRRTRNIVLGVVFLILGIVGLIVPVMPQFIFFFLSALFFSLVSPQLRRAMRRFRQRHPSLDSAYKKWREKARRKRQNRIRRKQRHKEEPPRSRFSHR